MTELATSTTSQIDCVLAVRNLGVTYKRGRQLRVAVDDVTIEVRRGETVGFIGESGAGKSTVARAVLGLVQPTSGSVEILGQDLDKASRQDRGALRIRVQAIMQNPYGSLDPRWRVDKIIAEPMWSAVKRGRLEFTRAQVAEKVTQLLNEVGLDAEKAHSRPAQLSGGERQRVAIARALSVNPVALVADEPITALDNTTKRQIVDLLKRLRGETDMGVLLISHSMSFIAELADRVYVITGGRIVEEGSVEHVIGSPQHAYTRRLLEASQVLDDWTFDESEELEDNRL